MYFTSNESLKPQLSIAVQHITVSVVVLELLVIMRGAVKLKILFIVKIEFFSVTEFYRSAYFS